MPQKELKVLIPWTTSMYKYFNGVHPFSRSWLDNNSFRGISFEFPKSKQLTISEQIKLFRSFSNNYISLLKDSGIEDWNEDWIIRHIRMLSIPNQMLLESQSTSTDLIFHHTVPLNCNSSNWILHFESPTTLFYPFVNHGEKDYSDLESLDIYKLVKAQLKSEKCKGIFSHIYENAEVIKRIFNDEAISQKVKYIPAGIHFPKNFENEIQNKIQKSMQNRTIKFFFTNSFQGNPEGFFLRGGLDVLQALGRIASKYENIELTILSHQPSTNPPSSRFGLEPEDFNKFIPASLAGKIRWVASGVSDEILDRLFLESDFFLLPSAGLHSMSALKALAHGCCTLVSDVPGFSEYITDADNGFVIKGRLEAVYSVDPKTGWYRDHYESMFKVNTKVADNLYSTLDMLITNDSVRTATMRRAIERIQHSQRIDKWCENFSEYVIAQLSRPEMLTAQNIQSKPSWESLNVKMNLFREYGIRMDFCLYLINLKIAMISGRFSYLLNNFFFKKIITKIPSKSTQLFNKLFLRSKLSN